MTATFYFHVADGDLRAEHAGDNVRIVVGNFGWTILLEDRLDCARWMKALADADALFIRRKAAQEAHELVLGQAGEVIGLVDPDCRDGKHASCVGGPCECDCHPLPGESDEPSPGMTEAMSAAPARYAREEDLEPLPPLPQRTPARPPAHPWQDAIDAELSPEALAGGVPLATLAPEPEDLPGPETGEWGTQSSVITSRAGEPLATLAPEPHEDEAEE